MAWDIEKVGDKIKKNPVPYIVGGAGVLVLGFLFWPRSSVSSYDRLPQEASFPPDYSQGSLSPGDLSSMFSNLSTMLVDMETRRSDELAAMTSLQLESMEAMQENIYQIFSELSQQQINMVQAMEDQAVRREQQQLSLLQEILSASKQTSPVVTYQAPATYTPPAPAPAASSSSPASKGTVTMTRETSSGHVFTAEVAPDLVSQFLSEGWKV